MSRRTGLAAFLSLLLLALIGTRAGGSVSLLRGLSAFSDDTLRRVTPVSPASLPKPGAPPAPGDTLPAEGTERIFIEHVDLWSFDKEKNPDAQLLSGNVVLRHQDAYMYCDSARLYEAENRFEAYGQVRIDQGDSLHIYCNYLDYDGNAMLARLRYLVRMEQGQTTLYTDSLDYDRALGIGYYFDHGTITDSLNILNSIYGEYDTTTRTATFKDDVVLENDNFTLYSDNLFYDTNTHIATILGPSEIVSDSGTITATRGTYDTEREIANLLDRARLTSGSQWMTGDSLFYDKKDSLALLFGNVILRDTTQKVELRGDYVEYHEDTEQGFARDSAYLVEYSSRDTLWAAAREMEMLRADSANHIFKGRGNVRLYRSNVQAVSDSIEYFTRDSLLNFKGSPFIWSGASQVTGDTVTLYMKDSALHHAFIRENAYLSARISEGPLHPVRDNLFNQLRGREVYAYFSNQAVDSVRTVGNAEVIYYNQQQDSLATEQVRSQSSAILMQFEKEEISRIVMLDKTTGTITPVPLISPSDLVYPGFIWFPEGRPTGKDDLFRTTPAPGSGMSEELQSASKPKGSLFSDPPPAEEASAEGAPLRETPATANPQKALPQSPTGKKPLSRTNRP